MVRHLTHAYKRGLYISIIICTESTVKFTVSLYNEDDSGITTFGVAKAVCFLLKQC